jgi:hypothetical protein
MNTEHEGRCQKIKNHMEIESGPFRMVLLKRAILKGPKTREDQFSHTFF